jgi:hypothetical protein
MSEQLTMQESQLAELPMLRQQLAAKEQEVAHVAAEREAALVAASSASSLQQLIADLRVQLEDARDSFTAHQPEQAAAERAAAEKAAADAAALQKQVTPSTKPMCMQLELAICQIRAWCLIIQQSELGTLVEVHCGPARQPIEA